MNQIDKEAPVRSGASIDRRRPKARAALLAFTASLVLLGAGAAPAMATLEFQGQPTSTLTNQDGSPATQAGSHPYQSVTSFSFTTTPSGLPTENVKDIVTKLPVGLIGDPTATPKCTVQELDNSGLLGAPPGSQPCPAASQVGQLALFVNLGGSPDELEFPLYNMVPPAGMPAQFGANVLVVNTFLDITVRTGQDYGLTATVHNASAGLPLTGSTVTLWGVPGDPSHDALRGATCSGDPSQPLNCNGGGLSSGTGSVPFLTLPTACTGQPLTTQLGIDSWQTPNPTPAVTASPASPAVTGCGRLSFKPSITVQPDTATADSPTGLNVDLHVPQAPDDAGSLASPALKTAAVTLPVGTVVDASAADGLQACSQSQFDLNDASEPTAEGHGRECIGCRWPPSLLRVAVRLG